MTKISSKVQYLTLLMFMRLCFFAMKVLKQKNAVFISKKLCFVPFLLYMGKLRDEIITTKGFFVKTIRLQGCDIMEAALGFILSVLFGLFIKSLPIVIVGVILYFTLKK